MMCSIQKCSEEAILKCTDEKCKSVYCRKHYKMRHEIMGQHDGKMEQLNPEKKVRFILSLIYGQYEILL